MSKEQTLEYLTKKACRLELIRAASGSPSERERIRLAIAKTKRRIRRVSDRANGLDKACGAVCKFLRKLDPDFKLHEKELKEKAEERKTKKELRVQAKAERLKARLLRDK